MKITDPQKIAETAVTSRSVRTVNRILYMVALATNSGRRMTAVTGPPPSNYVFEASVIGGSRRVDRDLLNLATSVFPVGHRFTARGATIVALSDRPAAPRRSGRVALPRRDSHPLAKQILPVRTCIDVIIPVVIWYERSSRHGPDSDRKVCTDLGRLRTGCILPHSKKQRLSRSQDAGQ